MLLTITTTHRPATDLGYLLHKNPNSLHARELAFGRAHLFYPEASEERCTAALLLDVDPVQLVRGREGAWQSGAFGQYVNDRPYVASSFLSAAISKLLGTALAGRSKERSELAKIAIPLEVCIAPLACRGGSELLDRLFAPLGYQVEVEPHPLDPAFPDWGDSQYVTVTLRATKRITDLLTHLFVLVPVLDNQKHYYVGNDEVEKLLAKGTGWLDEHPDKDLIVRRYLRNQRSLTRVALEGLAAREEPQTGEVQEVLDAPEEELEKPIRLNELRMETVTRTLLDAGASSVMDLGCGQGRLLRSLLKEKQITRIAGLDVAPKVLQQAERRLRLERMPDRQRARIELLQGSMLYRDQRMKAFDALAAVEVIEHLEPERLPAFERVVFAEAQPPTVVVTTPNREYNATFEDMEPECLRHPDHRFEWTRVEFESWARGVADRNDYQVEFDGIGVVHEEHGAPTQMAVFSR